MKEVLFHKYEVLSLIGSGGMGKVYLARDLHLDRKVVVKESGEEFLLTETRLLKELEHQGLPGIYDCFRQGERTFLVMEYIEGMSLRQYLDRYGRVPKEQALSWTLELCGILKYLHGRHPAIVYRDLKPENIMIRQDGRLKLIDFGGALRCGKGSERQALCVGTAGYSPPQQWQETRGDVTWDIYGLGAVLHEMLTGASPFHPPYGRRPLREYDRGLPSALDKTIRTCTAPEPAHRYPSVEELEGDLLRADSKNFPALGWRFLKKSITALGGGITAFCFIWPLLKGIPQDQFPFPYLEKPLLSLMITLLLYLFLSGHGKNKNYLRRQEKNIWLTKKQFPGLLSTCLALLSTTILSITFLSAVFPLASFRFGVSAVYAGEEQDALWVEMRDDQGRKMLLKSDAVYVTEGTVRFELPAERLPRQQLSVQIVAAGEDGTLYSSRVFLVRVKEENPDGESTDRESPDGKF